jgi:hypothetical protein
VRRVRRESAAFAILVCGLCGCDCLRDVKRCRELASQVNTTFDAVEHELAGSRSSESYTKIAGKYRELARKLEDFEGVTPELEKDVSELSTLSRSTARQSLALAGALEAKNPTSEALATRELEHLAKQERTLAQRINEECRPK